MFLRNPVGENYQNYLEDESEMFDPTYENEEGRPEYFNITFLLYEDGTFITRLDHFENFDVGHDKFSMCNIVEIHVF